MLPPGAAGICTVGPATPTRHDRRREDLGSAGEPFGCRAGRLPWACWHRDPCRRRCCLGRACQSNAAGDLTRTVPPGSGTSVLGPKGLLMPRRVTQLTRSSPVPPVPLPVDVAVDLVLTSWRSDGLHSEQTVARVGEIATRFAARLSAIRPR